MGTTKTLVTLSLPDTPDVRKFRQMYTDLEALYEKSQRQNQLLRQNVGGVIFDKEFYDLITAVYPRDSTVVGSAVRFVRASIDGSMRDIAGATELRYEASVSGAMRWPWSQEARLHPEEMRYM